MQRSIKSKIKKQGQKVFHTYGYKGFHKEGQIL